MFNTTLIMQKQLYDLCKIGQLDQIIELANTNINIHANNEYALHLACCNGHLNVVKFLVESGADFHMCDERAVRWASENGHLNVVQYLVELGANFHINHEFAICSASHWGHFNVVEYLLLKGAYHKNIKVDFNTINNLYTLQHYDLIKMLIDNKNHNISDEYAEKFNLIKKSIDEIFNKKQ